jgi:hypothetical protein
MTNRVVISQSMYFPWVGLFEQMRLANVYVRYDDAQYSKGSFTNRVQIKTPRGIVWMTVPLKGLRLGQTIDEVAIDDTQNWRLKHLILLKLAYSRTPYFSEMISLVNDVFDQSFRSVGDLAFATQMRIFSYLELNRTMKVIDIRELSLQGKSSQRVLDVVKAVHGDVYITGHGARHYLDHEMLERSEINVQYMQYLKTPYQQSHGLFTPYVSALDLIAHCGRQSAQFIQSPTCHWKEFTHESA